MVAEAYKAKSVPKSDWIQKLENLLTTLKIYRDVENAAMERICTILESKEIVISTEEIKEVESDHIRERMAEARKAREQEEKEQVLQGQKEREEEMVCQR